MPLGTVQFRSLLTNLSHNVRRDAGTLLSRMGHFTAREGRAFITEAWPELIRPYIDAAGDLTVEWYDGQPTTNTVFVPQPADPPPDEQLAANGRWAVGQDDPRDALGGAGERAVFNASRDTVLDNVIREDGARWVREARPGACNFCKLMTTRGAVYWTEASALTVTGRTVNIELADRRAIAAGQMTRAEAMARRQFYRSEHEAGKAGANVGDRRVGALRGTRDYGESYHDECRCLAVMVRPGDTYKPPEYAQSWEQDYKDAVTAAEKQNANQGVDRKLTIKDIVNAWDRNDREARGLKKRGPKPKPSAPSPVPQPGGGGDEPPTKPPTGGQSVQGDDSGDYPAVNGKEIPFTRGTAPTPTSEDMQRVLEKHRVGSEGKSPFPPGWSDDDIKSAIESTIRHPDPERTQWRGDKITFEKYVHGHLVRVHIRVDLDPPAFWSAYVPWE